MKGVGKFEDLVAWQLAVQLEEVTEEFCGRDPPGVGRFARIARASEQECLNHFMKARRKGCITPVEYEDARHSALKALKAVNGLIRYLDSTPGLGK